MGIRTNIFDFRNSYFLASKALLAWLIVLSCASLNAQVYPVTAQLNILPPYSPLFHTLSDISSAPYRANKIQLMLTLNDLNEPSLPVRLEWEISGPDVSFSSSSDFLDVPVTLIAGQPSIISNADLAGYFNPTSFTDFDVQGFSNSGGYLTEGEWTFCVTAYELTRGAQVSNTSCKFIFIEEYDPPIMIMPVDSVLPSFPQNIQVSWQPLHFGSFPVQYTVSIWEDIDGLTPDQITQAALPYYQKTVDQITNVFLQGDAPPFFTGQAYWAQVQVKDLVNGPMGAPSFVFKNDGKSEVQRFVYGMNLGEDCEIPGGLNYVEDELQDIYVYWEGGDPPAQLGGLAEPSSEPITATVPAQTLSSSARLSRFSLGNSPSSLGSISGQNTGPSFDGFYRVMWKNITDDTDWETSETQEKWVEISEFKRGRVYKVVVNRVCSSEELTSDTLIIELSAMPPPRPYECGQPPLDYVTENQDPLDVLAVGDTVIAGDIRVVISEATGSAGTFSGNGYFPAPMLKSVRIGVEFTSIFVNDEFRLVSGEINTIFDETGSNIMDVDSLLSLFDGMDQDLPDITVDGVIDTIIIIDDQAMVILENGDTVIVNQPVQVTGSDGATYVVSGGYVMPVVDIENLPQEFADGFRINFEQDPAQNYGFDGYKEALDDQYEDFAGYKIPYKSVAYGGRDGVLANVDFSIPGLIDSLKFYTESGLEYGFTKINENQVRLEVTGLSEGVERVVAVLPDTGIVGILNVASYSLYDIKVHLVPVNNVGNSLDVQSIQNDINRILLQGTFSATVDRLSGIFDTDSDGEIGAENHFLSAYSPDMQRILGKLETSEDNEFYIFLVDNLEGNVTGFMPKGLNKGFVDIGSGNLARTIAHELGHGPFTLDHSWEQYSALDQGSSDNLMDYNEGSGGGSALLYAQWEKMHNPDVEMPWVQDEEGALYEPWTSLDGLLVEEISDYENEITSFVSLTGKAISLPPGTRDFTFYKGYLAKFTIGNDRYISISNKNTGNFSGYFKDAIIDNESGQANTSNAQPFVSSITVTTKDVFYALEGEDCSQINLWLAKYNGSFTNDGGIGFPKIYHNTDITTFDELSDHTPLNSIIGANINCLRGRSKEFVKFIIEHYETNGVPISKAYQDTLIKILQRFAEGVFIYELDGATPENKLGPLKIVEMINYGHEKFLADLKSAVQGQILLPKYLVIQFENYENIQDAQRMYNIIKHFDPNCTFGEDIVTLIEKHKREYGEVKLNMEFLHATGKTFYEIFSLNEGFELLSCLLRNLRIPQSVYNPNRFDNQTTEIYEYLLEILFNAAPEDRLSALGEDAIDYSLSCGSGIWNSLVDLILGLSDLGAMVTNDPEQIISGVQNMPPLSDMGEGVWRMIKEHHGVIEGVQQTDSYQATYGVCYDVVFVASCFIGIGELAAIAKAGGMSRTAELLIKASKAFQGAAGVAFGPVMKVASKLQPIPRTVFLNIANHLPPSIYKITPDGIKSIIIAKTLDDAVMRFQPEGLFVHPSLIRTGSSGGTVLYVSDDFLPGINADEAFKISVVDEGGEIVLRAQRQISSFGELQAKLNALGLSNSKIDDLFAAVSSDLGQLDQLAKMFEELGSSLTPALVDDLLSANGSNLLNFIRTANLEDGSKVVNAWKRAKDAPDALRLNTDFLEQVVEWPATWLIKKGSVTGTIEVLDGSGIALARIFPDRVVASGRSVIGQPGNKILNRVPPIKNMTYEVDGIDYITDELGRVFRTSGDLDDMVRVRLGNQQIRAVDVKDGVRGTDQGGHIVGARFFGAGEQINYYSQAANLNQGAWKTMENGWAGAMVNGSDVKVDIKAIYNSNSFRPDKIEVEYWIDGDYTFREFDNL